MSYIISIETATPDFCHEQKNIANFFCKYEEDANNIRKINYVSSKSGISNRYSVLNDFSVNQKKPVLFSNINESVSLTSRMTIYKNNATNLALKAVLKINKFEELKDSITHIITVTCTGLFAPGLDVELISKLNLNPKTQRSSINFMGCNAAILALNSANNICNSIPNSNVLIVCVELCTLHFQNNSSDDFILANTLFSDGAAATIVSSNPSVDNCLKIESFNSLIVNKGQGDMTWQLSETGFIMNLTSYVSDLINGSMSEFLTGIDIIKDNIDFWAIHPGGKKIIDDFAKTLALNASHLQSSYAILRKYGNMSSPTILFVIKDVLNQNINIKIDNTIFCAAFGPGLSIETMQLKYV